MNVPDTFHGVGHVLRKTYLIYVHFSIENRLEIQLISLTLYANVSIHLNIARPLSHKKRIFFTAATHVIVPLATNINNTIFKRPLHFVITPPHFSTYKLVAAAAAASTEEKNRKALETPVFERSEVRELFFNTANQQTDKVLSKTIIVGATATPRGGRFLVLEY